MNLANRKSRFLFATIVILASFLTISGTAQANVQQTDDSAVSFFPALYWQQTLGNGLDFSVKDLTIHVSNPSADAQYQGVLYGFPTADYASGYGVTPIEQYWFYNYGSSTPIGFNGKVILTPSPNYGLSMPSFPLNPNRYYKISLFGSAGGGSYIRGSSQDSYPNGKAYYSSSSYPCGPTSYFNPETTCEPGINNGIADVFFQFGTAETLSGNESQVTTNTTRQGGAVIDGDLIAWMDNAGSGSPGDIYVYEISTGRKIRVTSDDTVKHDFMMGGRKILWTTWTNNNQWDKATFIHDLDTGITTDITEKIGIRKFISDFDGQRIVLQTPYYENPGIYLYDLATSELTLIDQDSSVTNPKISGNKILYQLYQGGNDLCGSGPWGPKSGLRLYDITTGEKQDILTCYGFTDDYAIDGNNIIIAYSGGPLSLKGIIRYEISTGKTISVSPPLQEIIGIDISGNIVVWSDTYDIFIYDIDTSLNGRTGMAPGASLAPNISGNTVVWDDYRAVTNESSNIDVYMYQLTPQNTPPTLSYSQKQGYESDVESPGVEPNEGIAEQTSFVFRIVYTDVDNDPPVEVTLLLQKLGDSPDFPLIDYGDYPLLEEDPQDTDYTDGKEYFVNIPLPEGKFRYYFRAVQMGGPVVVTAPFPSLTPGEDAKWLEVGKKETPLPDLLVDTASIDFYNYEEPFAPNVINVDAEVFNNGEADAENVYAKLFIDDILANIMQLGRINAGQKSYFTFTSKIEADTNLENSNLRIEAVLIEQEDANYTDNILIRPISFYYINFDHNEDAFSFKNWWYDSFDEYLEDFRNFIIAQWNEDDLTTLITTSLIKPLSDLFTYIIGTGGHCYGMAASSMAYYLWPDVKPVDKITFSMEEFEAKPDIIERQWEFLLHVYPALISTWNDITRYNATNEYNQVLHYIRDLKQPIGLTLRFKDRNGGHAVVAYKILDLGDDEKRVYVYDNNDPLYLKRHDQYVTFRPVSNEANYKAGGYEYTRVFATEPWQTIGTEELRSIIKTALDKAIDKLWRDGLITINIFSPVSPLITDNLGRRIGYSNGELINEIPGASITEQMGAHFIELPKDFIYTARLAGTDNGTVGIEITTPVSNTELNIGAFRDIPVLESLIITISLNGTNYIVTDTQGNIVEPLLEESISSQELEVLLLLSELRQAIKNLDTVYGIKTALITKVDAVKESFKQENTKGIINQLNALKNHIKAQRGKHLTSEDADKLMGVLEKIRDLLLYSEV